MSCKYKAFISYRHLDRDSAAAKALHTMIENYTIPRKLRKNGMKKPGRVFRDEEELSASNDLSQHIRDALDTSEFLIVICSPDVLGSKWVPEEIAYFLEHHAPEKLLTVLTGGRPEEIFPILLPNLPEPLSVDLTESPDKSLARDLKERFLKLCAPLLGCEYDDLVMRDQKRKRRLLCGWIIGITAVAAVIIGILLWSNHQIEGKNRELETQNQEILLRESELLTQEALQSLESGDQSGAIRNAISALPSAESSRPYYAPAERTLFAALDPLNENATAMITQDTVLEQTSPVKDFCISADGSLLTTVDAYSLLTCFDTVTGEQVWTRKLIAGTFYSDTFIYSCELWNSIIVACDQSITGIAQDTGAVLWSVENGYFEELIELSDDGRYVACMIDQLYSNSLSFAVISTEDGTVLNTYPVAESSLHLDLPGSDAYDFSSDGTQFAGCYIERHTDNTYALVYFVTDLTTGSTETVCSQTIDDIYGIYGNVCLLAFTDQDTTLTVARESGNIRIAATVEKVSIPDKTLLWQTNTTEESDSILLFFDSGTHHFISCDSYILLSAQNYLYALDPQTGEPLASRNFESDLLQLEQRNDGYFALTLADGTHSFGWLNSNGLFYTGDSLFFHSPPSMELGPIQSIALWNDGYMRICLEENGPTVFIDSEENGFGYAAVIPQDNNQTVVVKRAALFQPNPDREVIFTSSEGEELSYREILICGADTLAFESISNKYEDTQQNHYILLDRESLKVKDTFTLPASNSGYDTPFVLQDGKGLLHTNKANEICAYDAATQSETTLTPKYGEVQLYNGDIPIHTRSAAYQNGRLSCDYSALTAMVTIRGLKLWINGEAQTDVIYPKELNWPNMKFLSTENMILGANGYILLDLLLDIEKPTNDSYFLYSISDGQWYRIPFGENDAAHHVACLGETSPLFTVMDNQGLIRIFDIPSGIQTLEVSTGLSSNAVPQLKWIMEDRYLTVYTKDQQLLIIDGTTGETVYQSRLSEYYFSNPPYFAADPQGKRLYIWNHSGICVDIESWTTLLEIQNIDLYDPVSDRILYIDWIYEEDSTTDCLVAYRLPTTEELIELGKQYLGE